MLERESADARAIGGASISSSRGALESAEAHGHYTVECISADGSVKWSDQIENLVTTVGKNFALDTLLSGSGYTASVVMDIAVIHHPLRTVPIRSISCNGSTAK